MSIALKQTEVGPRSSITHVLVFLIDFFMLNSNLMSASLKSLGILVNSRSKVTFKVKYDISLNKARNKCTTGTSFSCDINWAIYF